MLPRHVCFVYFHLHCNKHSLLLSSCLSMMGKIKSPSCSACGQLSQDTSHSALFSYRLLMPFVLWRLFVFMTSGPGPGQLPGFWVAWFSGMALSLGWGRVANNLKKQCSSFCNESLTLLLPREKRKKCPLGGSTKTVIINHN